MTLPLPPDVPLPIGFSPLVPGDPLAIGPFSLVGRVGSGGMGAVYGALDAAGTRIAVKVIHPRYAADPAYRAQFAREADLLSRVDAECAPAFFGADPDSAQPWLATEFVQGRTLKEHVAEHGPLSGAALVGFAAGTAEALAAVHAAGIVHRDVKPANIILSPSGPRVLDFGIARAADDTGEEAGVYGTPGWVAPERLRGAAATTAADMFAWGGLVVYAATGHGPYGAGDPRALIERARTGTPSAEAVPDDLRPLVERALAGDPQARPDAAEVFAAVLDIAAAAARSDLAHDATLPDLDDLDRRVDPRRRLRALLARAWRGFDTPGRGAGRWVAAATLLSVPSGVAGGIAARGGAEAAGAGGAAATGAIKGAAIVAVGATAVAVVTGGWIIGRTVTDSPVPPVPEPAPETSTASSDPDSTSAPASAQQVGFRGLAIGVPPNWRVERVEDDFATVGEQTPVQEEWVALFPDGGSCSGDLTWTNPGGEGCEHVKVLGPAGIARGGPGNAPIDQNVYYVPSTEVSACPEGMDLTPMDPADQPIAEPELVPIGDRQAYLTEWSVPCTGTGGEYSAYPQRMWFLPDSEILIVDNAGADGLDDILAAGEFG